MHYNGILVVAFISLIFNLSFALFIYFCISNKGRGVLCFRFVRYMKAKQPCHLLYGENVLMLFILITLEPMEFNPKPQAKRE